MEDFYIKNYLLNKRRHDDIITVEKKLSEAQRLIEKNSTSDKIKTTIKEAEDLLRFVLLMTTEIPDEQSPNTEINAANNGDLFGGSDKDTKNNFSFNDIWKKPDTDIPGLF